jgi:formylglycine-generating enzyme required for sulfatase activity
MIEPLISALGELDLTSQEIADVVWLALQMQESDRLIAGSNQLNQQSPRDSQSKQAAPSSSPQPTAFEQPLPTVGESQVSTDQPPDATVGLYGPEGEGLPLRVPDARSLRDPLPLAKALKPLLRLTTAGPGAAVDEAATVERIIQQGLWLPVLQPVGEPALELALVVDESLSMQLWQQTIADLQRLLTNYGMFRDVRVWGLGVDATGQVGVRPGIGSGQRWRSPYQLLDPAGQRLIWVATDCVGEIWQQGQLQPVLKRWAKHGPVAIAQMLPEWLWQRTKLGFATPVRLAGAPGVPNQQLQVENLSAWDEVDVAAGVKLPVVTLEPQPLGAWAAMLVGQAGAGGVVIEPSPEAVDRDAPQEPEVTEPELAGTKLAEPELAEARVAQFRVTASPMARRLAGLLAAAPVINLPVVRIIQETLLPESRQVHVAEVFLGGLLAPLAESTTQADAMQYGFLDGVREALLESVPTSKAIDVFDTISGFIAKEMGISIEQFKAVLRHPYQPGHQGWVNQVRPFARISAQILRQLGGDYRRFAEELQRNFVGLVEPAVGQLDGQAMLRGRGSAIALHLRPIPAGTFLMGSPEGEKDSLDDERPQHKVTVPEFYLSQYPITQAQWKAIALLPQINRKLKPDPSYFKGDNLPVEQVSWHDAVEFCDRLSKASGRAYRLPTEAEWEYACRAGTTTPFYFGENITKDQVNFGRNRGQTTDVGIFPPNAFGLYDMHGNVWEWCQDHWHNSYKGAPTDGSAWITKGAKKDVSHIRRGGSWIGNPVYCRCAYRSFSVADRFNQYIGFRVACVSPGL